MDVFFEFHAIRCLVKDKIMRKILLQGRIKNGLYQLQGPNFITAKEVEKNNSYGINSTTQIKRKMNFPLDQLNSSFNNLLQNDPNCFSNVNVPHITILH